MPQFNNIIINKPEDQELLMCFAEQPLEQKYFTGNYLFVVDIDIVDNEAHQMIIKKILIGEDYWRSDLSLANDGFSAFFHGYLNNNDYEKFRNLIQKLNVVMHFLYDHAVGVRSNEEQMEIDRLLCQLLKKMESSGLFGSKKLVGINRVLRILQESLVERDLMMARERIQALEKQLVQVNTESDKKLKNLKEEILSAFPKAVEKEVGKRLAADRPASILPRFPSLSQKK